MNNIIIYFLNTYGVFILYFAVLSYLWFVEKSREEALHVIFASGVTAFLSLLLKEMSGVPRPYVALNTPALAGLSQISSSLPSFHTALAFTLATTVAFHQKKLGLFLLICASLIGFGRVFANVHYPTDVAIGAIVGTMTSLLVDRIHIPYPFVKTKSRKRVDR